MDKTILPGQSSKPSLQAQYFYDHVFLPVSSAHDHRGTKAGNGTAAHRIPACEIGKALEIAPQRKKPYNGMPMPLMNDSVVAVKNPTPYSVATKA
jgi:hypothetical protein